MHFRRRCDRQGAGHGEGLRPRSVTGEETQLRTISMKSFAGFIGGSAILVACGLSLGYSGESTNNVAGDRVTRRMALTHPRRYRP